MAHVYPPHRWSATKAPSDALHFGATMAVMKPQATYVWFDGRMRTFEKVSVALLNHSLHYGTAAFEGIRCYETPKGPAVFRLRDHVRRLFHSAAVMGMKVPYTQKEVRQAIVHTIAKNKLRECYIRPIVYYGEGMGLLPQGTEVHVAIAVWPWGQYIEGDDTHVHIVRTRRLHPESGVMTAKVSGHYFNSVLASLEAKRERADEALLLDHRGNVAEGPGENIFFVQGSTIHTPRPDFILPGLTRATVMLLARDMGYMVVEKDISPARLPRYEEAFFVGTAVEVHPIGRIDSTKYESACKGSATLEIQRRYAELVHGDTAAHAVWRTPVSS